MKKQDAIYAPVLDTLPAVELELTARIVLLQLSRAISKYFIFILNLYLNYESQRTTFRQGRIQSHHQTLHHFICRFY
ncbi:MAG: hypothetical protein M3R27_06550, partial [Bacteroidota bacterium]|nr:hypothetical protein [Bacteroidota bacterium]